MGPYGRGPNRRGKSGPCRGLRGEDRRGRVFCLLRRYARRSKGAAKGRGGSERRGGRERVINSFTVRVSHFLCSPGTIRNSFSIACRVSCDPRWRSWARSSRGSAFNLQRMEICGLGGNVENFNYASGAITRLVFRCYKGAGSANGNGCGNGCERGNRRYTVYRYEDFVSGAIFNRAISTRVGNFSSVMGQGFDFNCLVFHSAPSIVNSGFPCVYCSFVRNVR